MTDTMYDMMFAAALAGGGGSGFTPTEEQLTAMNSGITATDVQQINTNKTNISSLQAQPKLYVDDSGYIAVNYGSEE